MKKIYVSVLVALSIYSSAQNVFNAKLNEINFGSSGTPGDLIKLNDFIIFPATRFSDEGRELWSFNSVTQKSSLLKDIFPGHNSGLSGSPSFVNVNGKIYFVAQQSFSGYQIWSTDGTAAGTVKEKDLISDYSIGNLVVAGNKIFYYIQNELWSFDTVSKDLLKVKTFVYSGDVKMYSFNNELILGADDGVHGKEIWKSDGTLAGTVLLKDIIPNQYGSVSGDFNILPLHNKFYFIASLGTGYGLYESDGTEAGTVSVKPLRAPRLNGISADNYFVFEGFDPDAGGMEPWISDGTAAGTKMLKNLMPGNTSSMANSKFIKLNNKIYFDSNANGVSPAYGDYVWETDGTEAGTVLFNTPPETELYGKSSDGTHLILTKPNYGNRYWITNGNPSQTFEITDIGMPYNNSFIDLNSKIYLTGYNPKNGTELFSVNPVSQTSSLATDISRFESSAPHSFEVLNNELIFIAADRQYNNQLYKRNKNTQQLERLSSFGNTSFMGMFSDNKDTFFKVGNYLYTKNGTPNPRSGMYRTAGTEIYSEGLSTSPGTVTYDNSFYVNLNDNTLLFSGYNNVIGTELWKIDNDTDTAVLVKDISADNMGSMYNTDSQTAVLNGFAYFIAKENGKLGIWKSDGTSAGTSKAIQFNYQDGGDGDIKVLKSFNNKLFFTKRKENNSSYSQNELWTSDGDQASAVLVKDHTIPFGDANISRETEVLNNKLLYITTGYFAGLHSTDGTVAGTTEILSSNFFSETKFKKCGNQLFFTNNNSTQLWRTDGTTSGTFSLTSNLSSVKDMICANNYLYFLNGDSQKVWKTNGTVSNTMAMDIFVTNDDNQLLANENIEKLATDGERLYLSIATKNHGSELYEITDALPVYLATDDIRQTDGKNANADIQIYPNPVTEYFSVKTKGSDKIQTVKIYDATGKLIRNITNTTEKINVSDISSGIYFIRIKTDKGEHLGKIIKK
ncbi:T9SS type A sorting domain-containing protein [Chryseobacterium sp. RP-3-3]|uniref:T9SS type A sorting domain-containing protein n=1 Tax=Chryseobacterium antibioticum TaxID=2728847 RepID=A0A7Y0FSK2_9FLAO|nr:T9SS type A sorting domain-containing protein [Chryseobacterium antibioticum]NML70741.1 T9SS type A sorting domain-containing protein [Chryseobacterium antibioticum]